MYEDDNKICSNMVVGFEYGLLFDDSIIVIFLLCDEVLWKVWLVVEEVWCL